MTNTEQLIQTIPSQTEELDRKKDHIELAFQSQTNGHEKNTGLNYEPILSGHPEADLEPMSFLGKTMNAPLWISSMTGGTEIAQHINHNLAKVCGEFGLGMGLGSCRKLLEDDRYFDDFNLRPIIGYDHPFFANLGIAQIEESLAQNKLADIIEMINRLEADGLIIHVNPLQEWLQPEGDKITQPPIDTIKAFLDKVNFKVIVKEVGQGMGPKSLKALFELPLAAVDFAAFGGTNFSKLELLRGDEQNLHLYSQLAAIGHSADEMTRFTNEILNDLGDKALCKQVIISGGIQSFLEGYQLINKINCTSVYGQGSAFLKHAQGSYDELQFFVSTQIKGLQLANALLEVKK